MNNQPPSTDVTSLLAGLVNDYKTNHPELAAKERAQARQAATDLLARSGGGCCCAFAC